MNWISVQSNNLKEIAYDNLSNSLFIKFHHGRTYQYFDVPNNIYQALLNASSHGKFHHIYIKNKFRYQQINI